MLGRVVSGFRTWIWTMAAPALAASIADCAICAGVTGTAGFLPGVSAEPVTAQAIITLRFMFPPAGACRASLAQVAAKARPRLQRVPRPVVYARAGDLTVPEHHMRLAPQRAR